MTKTKERPSGATYLRYLRRRAGARGTNYERRISPAFKSLFTPSSDSRARVDARVLFHHFFFLALVCLCAASAATRLVGHDWSGLAIFALLAAGPVVAVSLLQHSPSDSDDHTAWHEVLDRSGALLLMWLAFIGLGLASQVLDALDLRDVPGGDALVGLLTILGLYYMLTDLRVGVHAVTHQRLRHRGLLQRAKDGFFAIVFVVVSILVGLLAGAANPQPTSAETNPDMYCYPTDTAAMECFDEEQKKRGGPSHNGGGAERPATRTPAVSQ